MPAIGPIVRPRPRHERLQNLGHTQQRQHVAQPTYGTVIGDLSPEVAKIIHETSVSVCATQASCGRCPQSMACPFEG